MAASLRRLVLGSSARNLVSARTPVILQTWTRTAFFRRGKDKESEAELAAVQKHEEVSVSSLAKNLRKREGLQTVRGYTPPADVEARVHKIASVMCGQTKNLTNFALDDRKVKFQLLTRLMSEFDHHLPNTDLTNINTVGDAVVVFSTPVRDTTSYEDLSKLDLPPNLHIQMEPLRFDPDTDTMFGGVSAFPGQKTVVSSLKYRRKYGKKE